MNAAIKKDFYNKRIQDLRDKKFVMIFDECHRSHFGECHRNIVNFFRNLQIFGFTGTPIFPENAKQDITTYEVFGECLHKYMIKDAIADENVLGFLVEYYQGKLDANEQSDIRMKTIAEFIVNNFRKSTFDGEFNALFAVQSSRCCSNTTRSSKTCSRTSRLPPSLPMRLIPVRMMPRPE